tara:strand:+ start:40 stop:816 length:777 start_codon:yes stop_codon:yes gene_type:complete
MANWSTGKPKIGDTRGWNERDQTGYKWDGKKWVQYYKGKPLGPFKGHGGITGNVDVVGGIKSGVLGSANRIGRAITGAPSDEDYQFVEEQGGRLETKHSNINEYFNSILQERWDNATTEEEKASVKDLLASFNVGLEKDIIREETGAGTTSVIPETFSQYRNRTRSDAEHAKILNESSSAGEVAQKEILNPVENQKGPPPLPPLTDIEPPQYSADPNDKNFKGILSPLEAEGEIDLAAQAQRRKLFEKNRIKDEDRYG